LEGLFKIRIAGMNDKIAQLEEMLKEFKEHSKEPMKGFRRFNVKPCSCEIKGCHNIEIVKSNDGEFVKAEHVEIVMKAVSDQIVFIIEAFLETL
jgi:hypothetical protein